MSRNSVSPRVKSVLIAAALLGLFALVFLVVSTQAASAAFRLKYVEGVEPKDGIAAPVVTMRITDVQPGLDALARGRRIAAHRAAQAAAVRPASGRVNWDALARCESSGNWGINTGNGYYGGVQMTHSNWLQHRPPGAPAYAHQASKAQQIHAAEGILREQGTGAWPPLSRAECN